jgi:hypothetical protein
MSIAPHAGQRTGGFGSSLLASGFIEAPEAGSVPAKTPTNRGDLDRPHGHTEQSGSA